MFFFTVSSFIILGIATLWSVRVIFGDSRNAANHTITISLSIIGWVFIFLGIATMVTPFGIVLVLIVFGMAVARYRHGERKALLWILSLAAAKGMPFSPSIRAFAARRSDEMARRALALADMIDAGVPLSKALADSHNPLSKDTELMVRLSADSSTAAAALRESGEFNDDSDVSWSPIFGQMVYLAFVVLVTILVFTFVMIKIMPTYRAIFEDFGVDLPAVTELVIAFSNLFARYAVLFTPVLVYVVVSILVGAFFYARGQIWLPPPLNWLFGRTDKPTMLRGLAVCVQQKLPMHEAFRRLGRDYPSKRVQKQLAECAGATAVGANWCDVMQEQDLVSPAESAVLKASVPTGNLGWALRELAEVATRRMFYRAKAILNVVSALSILLIALPTALLAFGCFIPLVTLIQEMAAY